MVDPPSPTLVVITGPPGTGKSTLADHAAGLLAAPVLAWDWAMGALTGFDPIMATLRDMPSHDHRRVGWSVLMNLATAQLRRRCSVVLDGVARDDEIATARALARTEGASAVVVLTSCRDLALHRQRVEGRERRIPGWHELDWDHVERFLERWRPPVDVDLDLDAADLFDENLGRLTTTLNKGRAGR